MDTTENMHAQAPDNNRVFVSEVIGEGDDSHRIVRVSGWSMVVRGTNVEGEPEIPDTLLAPRLGLPLHKLRELSARHEKAGHISPRAIYPTVGGNRGRPGKQRFYTEADALFLVTRSEAEGAVALTREMIRVFMLARRGLLRPVATPTDPTMALAMAQALSLMQRLEARFEERLSSLSAEVGTLRTELATGVIGEAVAQAEIHRPLSRIAAILATPTKGARSVRRRFENQLRALLGHAGPGSRWSMLPRRLLAVAQHQVTRWLDEAIALRAEALKGRQGQLPLPIKPN